MPTLRSTRKATSVICDEHTSVGPQGVNKTIIPFALVGYETG